MLDRFIAELTQTIISDGLDKESISRLKVKLAGKYGLKKIPTDIEVLMSLPSDKIGLVERYLTTKPTRTISGVAVVAIMTKPFRCPHGRCIYCPGGLDSEFGDVPQSYTGHEPSTMRGIRNDYDPYLQVMNRLEQYVVIGQSPEKVELILMGGTFPFFPRDYQVEFVSGAFQAMNDFSYLFYNEDGFDILRFKEFFELPGQKDESSRLRRIKEKLTALREQRKAQLDTLKDYNESESRIRCVGLTIETKPDYGLKEHGLLMLELGCTRVELGIQSLYDEVLRSVNRGHTLEDTKRSIRELRDLGFKLNFHMMPGLPGVTEEMEKEQLRQLFIDPAYRPDMVKIYPTMVFRHTGLYSLYKAGKYTPLSTEKAASIIAEFMAQVPLYCRVMRVQRDIPTSLAEAGVGRNNLRQYIDLEMKKKNLVCKDIRAREIGHIMRERSSEEEGYLTPKINVLEYEASGGKEFFISIDDDHSGALIGFCRLRLPSSSLHEEITDNTAIIRELHVYGTSAPIGKDGEIQHRGFGRRLMDKAEEIGRDSKRTRIAVISGVGVREYYKKLGYTLRGPYMVKEL